MEYRIANPPAMKTGFQSRLADLAVSTVSLALLAAVFTACEHESGNFSIDTPGNFENLTALTDIAGTWEENGSGTDTLTGVRLTLMRQSDNKFWNGTSWGSSFDLPTTISTGTWQITPGTNLPSGSDLQPDYYLIEAYAAFTLEPSTHNVMFSVGVVPPPVLPTPWAWGSNGDGRMGVGNLPGGSTPLPVFMRGALEGKIVTGLAAGGSHTLALTSDGHLYSWGDDAFGQLGSTALPDTGGAGLPNNFAPVMVDDTGVLSGKEMAFMAAGGEHSLAVSSGGLVFAWGNNQYGQLGQGTTSTSINLPVAVTGLLAGKHIDAVSAGSKHSIALKKDTGELYAWGYNFDGELGDGTNTNRNAPVAVTGLGGVVIVAVDCGWRHNLAVTNDGKLYAWGDGDDGQLGNGGTAGSNVPLLVSGPWGTKKIVSASAGSSHSLALDEDGKVYAWGQNSDGQLGLGDLTDRLSPVQVTGVLVGQDVHRVEAGATFSLAQTHDNKVFSWGSNGDAQLAHPTEPNTFTPQEAILSAALSGGRVILGLSAGEAHVEMLTGFSVKPQPEIEVEAQGAELTHGGTLNFGSFGVGTSNPVWVTVRNRGTSDLTDLSITIDGPDQFEFFGAFFSPPIPPNDPSEHGFYVFFAPNNLGTRTATVHIASNDADENPFDFTITGTGLPMGQVDLAFDPGVTGDVYGTAVQPDGKIVVTGSYVRVNGPSGPARNRAARVDGTTGVADAFDPDLDSFTYCSAVLPDGKVMIGGAFTTVGGVGRNRLARLNADGTLDPTFNAQITFSGTVYGMALQSDGKLLIAGNFSSINGVGQAYLARLNADGTLDSGFTPVLNSSGRCVAVQADGNIIVSGQFNSVNGQGFNKIARLSGIDGSLDPSFSNPNIVTKSNVEISCLAVQSNGKILVGGNIQTVDGETRNGMCRLNADGTLDTSFDPDVNGDTSSIVVQANGRILISGQFTTVGGTPGTTRNRIAMLLPNGQLEQYFDPNADSAVLSLALQADGKILAGGGFSNIGGEPRSKLARLSNDTATQALYLHAGAIIWERGGASPETNLVTFDVSGDGGASWTPLGPAARYVFPTAHWELYGATLPPIGHIRARAYPQGGRYNGSVSCLQTIAAYGLPPEIAAMENSVPVISGATRSFGVVTVGSSSSVMQLTILNAGGDPLTGLGTATIVDNNPFDSLDHTSHFQLGRPAANTLNGGATTTLTVTYRPKTTGLHEAILRILTNDPDEFPFDIFLTATGGASIAYVKTQFGIAGKPDTDDTDGDGIVDLLDIAIGANPTEKNSDGTSVSFDGGGSSFAPSSEAKRGDSLALSGGTFFFNYQRNKLSMGELIFQVEWSDTLGANDWHTDDVTEEILSDDGTLQQVRATVPSGSAGRRFVRLKVTRP